MRKKTSTTKVYNGPVLVEVKAKTAKRAKQIAAKISGLKLNDDFQPVPMAGGTWTLSGVATNVTNVPVGVTVWPKSTHQMHT
jgi:hypothetical protein